VEMLLKEYLVYNRLRFSGDLERQFKDDYFAKTIPITRFALALALVLYALFGILDIFISPQTKHLIWLIRYAAVCPLIILVLILTFFAFFKSIMQGSLIVLSIIMGFGIIIMIITARDVAVGLYYYAGLILVIVWGYTLVKLRFVQATVVGWVIVCAYEFAAVFYQEMWRSDQLINAYISNNFFFISANIIGMFAAYYMEAYTRRDFLQRLLIIENQKKIEIERNRLAEYHRTMTAELDMARVIQQKIIPREKPVPFIASLFHPMEPVGGDLYDFIRFRELELTGIFLSDVSGHGVPAALITMMIKSILAESGIDKRDPAQLLRHMNEHLRDQMAGNFATAFYGIYDNTKKTITYSSAGHTPPFVIHGGSISKLESIDGGPLCYFSEEDICTIGPVLEYTTKVAEIPRPGKILFYTDGLTEARNDRGGPQFFSIIMDEILLGMAHLPCDEFIERLYRELVVFRGSDDFDDDVCMICLDID
jgi:serine phosphatase RsbU (regulator of sigma subunit)